MKANGVRTVLSLDGKWAYSQDPDRKGEEQKLFDPNSSRKDWGEMEIPVNWYNAEVGDYHGVIWFAKEFELPKGAKGREHFLRFNAVRIGSHVEQSRFYELCDEMGFMVWQVFPMHWGKYRMEVALSDKNGEALSENWFEFQVHRSRGFKK